jgi:hypothetical protein
LGSRPYRTSRTCNGDLSTTGAQRPWRRFEHLAANRIEHQIGTLPVRQGFDLDSNIPGLDVNEDIGRVPSNLANA